MNVASDASPLICLSQVGHFALLQALFAAVYIPVWSKYSNVCFSMCL